MIIVRYADDIVVGFEQETDARRFWDAMRDRLQEFSLSSKLNQAGLFRM
jgi:RNA-directed DNA polymerase